MPDHRWKRPLERADLHRFAPLAGLAVLLLFFGLCTDGFFRLGTLTNLLEQGSVLAIASVGLTFVLICGEIDLSVGAVALWTACSCGWILNLAGTPEQTPGITAESSPTEVGAAWIVAAVALPLVSSLLLGVISGSLTAVSGLPSFIITLAMMFVAQGGARYLTKSQTLPVPEFMAVIGNDGIPITTTLTIPYSAILAAVLFVVGHVVLTHTRFGRYVLMSGGNREAARLAGIRTNRIVIATIAIAAVTAGIAGLVNAGRLGNASLDQNQDLLLNAVACVVLGGTSLFGGEGSLGRTLVGVATFTVLYLGLQKVAWIDDLARQLLMGVVLLGALVVNGLLAKGRR
jgi:ribose transport system permease protein